MTSTGETICLKGLKLSNHSDWAENDGDIVIVYDSLLHDSVCLTIWLTGPLDPNHVVFGGLVT